MIPGQIETRRDAYVYLLTWGLLAIRASACRGDTRLCKIEADHIHNLPSLLDEQNDQRHRYYIENEREHYLAQLQSHADASYREQMVSRYESAWKMLMDVAAREKGMSAGGLS